MNDTQIKNGIKIGLVNKSKRINALLKSYKSQRDYVFKWDELVQNEHRIIKNLMLFIYPQKICYIQMRKRRIQNSFNNWKDAKG